MGDIKAGLICGYNARVSLPSVALANSEKALWNPISFLFQCCFGIQPWDGNLMRVRGVIAAYVSAVSVSPAELFTATKCANSDSCCIIAMLWSLWVMFPPPLHLPNHLFAPSGNKCSSPLIELMGCMMIFAFMVVHTKWITWSWNANPTGNSWLLERFTCGRLLESLDAVPSGMDLRIKAGCSNGKSRVSTCHPCNLASHFL